MQKGGEAALFKERSLAHHKINSVIHEQKFA